MNSEEKMIKQNPDYEEVCYTDINPVNKAKRVSGHD